MAVAVRRYIADNGNMEMRPSLQDRLAVFRHLIIQDVIGFAKGRFNGILGTDADAAPTAHAVLLINKSLMVSNRGSIVGADFGTHSAANAFFLCDIRLALAVHFHFPSAGAAAHANIFQCAAKAGHLMSLEMGQRDNHIGIHNGVADLGFLDVFAVHWHQRFVCPFQPIANDHMASSGKRAKSIFIGSV